MAMLVRLAALADAPALAAIYRPYVENSRISFEESAPDDAEMARRIAGEAPGLYPGMVAEEDGRPLGFASSSPFRSPPAYRWTVVTGVYIAADAQGRGLGRLLLSGLLELLERQGFVAAIGAIALPNAPSVRLHEALGFTRSGTYRGVGFKCGEWIDVGLWQRELAARTADPAEPRPFGAFVSSADGACVFST